MKQPPKPQSATALSRAPREDSDARSVKYLLMMALRIVCFILMVVLTPYGWYTWILGAAAVFLPYVAVIFANVGKPTHGAPDRPGITTPPPAPLNAPGASADSPPEPKIFRMSEAPTPAPSPGQDETVTSPDTKDH